MTLIKTIYEVAKIALKYGQKGGKLASGEASIIRKLPPGYRKSATTLLRGLSTVTTGGIVSDIIKDYMIADDSPGNAIQKPYAKPPTGTPYKTRNRRTNRSRYRNTCYVQPRRKFRRTRSR